MRAANVLYKEGRSGIEGWTRAVSQQGAAAELARTLTDNLRGDLERLGGAFDTVFIGTGGSANDSLRTLVQGAEGLVEQVGKIPGPVLLAGGAFTALALGLPKGILTWREYKATLSSVGISLDAVSAKAPRTATALGVLSKASTAIALSSIATGLAEGADKLGLGVEQMTSAFLTSSNAVQVWNAQIAKGADLSNISSGVSDLKSALDATFNPGVGQNIDDVAGKLYAFTGGTNMSDIEVAARRFDELDQVLANLTSSGNGAKAGQIFQQIADQARTQGYSIDQLRSVLPQYQEALAGATNQQQLAAGTGDGLKGSLDGVVGAAGDAATGTSAFADALDKLNRPALDASSAAIAYQQAIADANKSLKENGRTLDITTQKGRDNKRALNEIASAAQDLIDTNSKNGASEATLRAQLATSRRSLEVTATRFGLTKAQAKAYVDQVLQIPPAATTTVTAKTAAASAAIDGITAKLNRIANKTVRTFVETIATTKSAPYTTGGIGSLLDPRKKADGGAISDPGTATSDSIPALLSNGEHVWTAKEVAMAGGQGAMYRARALVKSGALRFANGGAVGFADGGEVDFQAILALLADVTTSQNVADARQATATRAVAVKSAQASLAALRAQYARNQRALAAARKTRGSKDDLAALEARRVLLAKISAAEDNVSLAVTRSTAAKRAQIAIEREYAADRRPILDRATSAGVSATSNTKAFLDNIDKLTGMGFKTLALTLLDQGGPEAEQIAAQTVKSAAKARQLEGELSTSAALSNRESAIRAALTGMSGTGDLGALGWYQQIRDLGPAARGYIGATAPAITNNIEVNGALDPVSVGRQVEKVLQAYANVSGGAINIAVKR